MYLNRQMNCSDVWSGCGFWTDRNQIEKNPAELSTHNSITATDNTATQTVLL